MNAVKNFYTASEVAAIIRTSRTHVYRRIEAGEIPAVKIGEVIRVPAWWIDQLGAQVVS
ncbi:MAG: helix-turn-helix domain-containing protein [Thermaerobacter sp.]|nr:helix-turn-helix domain-containing protein [Thermaerobacter sp.]